MSFHDTGTNNEYSYHMLLAGFFYALDSYYITKSNVEAGYGRADIILFPRDKSKAGYILELKRAYTKTPEKEVEKALQQIDDNKYYVELERYGVKEIIKLGYRQSRISSALSLRSWIWISTPSSPLYPLARLTWAWLA